MSYQDIQDAQEENRKPRESDSKFFDRAKEIRKREVEAENAAWMERKRVNAERLAKVNELFIASHQEDVKIAGQAEADRKAWEEARKQQALEDLERGKEEARLNPLH